MDNQNNEPKYKMTIGLSVLEHLGIGLYSNVPAVLSEVVANAWDADAENVCISIDPDQRKIVISDDGSGMTVSDINEKYLKVGYKKRDSEPITPKFKRQPMGRKGIGKLSLFSIAETIEIHTVKDGEKNAFRMNSADIRSEIKNQTSDDDYYPKSLPDSEVAITQGTKIKLTSLRKQIKRTDKYLRRRLARRFSIIGRENFNVKIDDKPISAKDRDYYTNIQYLWYFGEESKKFKGSCSNADQSRSICEIVDQEKGYQISGWIGTVEKQSQIDEDINSIVIFANGKLVHENMLKDMKEGGVWTKYIIGEIDADFMDDSNEEDIITSARQSLKEDDQRYIQLKGFLQQAMKRHIGTNWQKWRRKAGSKKVLRERKNIKRWYDRLKGDLKDYAEELLGKIEALEVGEADKKELYKASMFAFEKLSITQQLSILNRLETEKDFELISKIFGNLTELTSVHYYDIAKARVEIIKKFKKIIDEDNKERVIQKHIFNALWLLDPSWERAATNSRMEETVTKEFENMKQKLTEKEKRARIDIRYQTVAGKHVIIELKRYSASISIYALLEQMDEYKKLLQTCLEYSDNRYRDMPVEIICITGKRPRTEETERLLIAASARWLTYDELIDNALNSYQEYLNAEERISELISIINSLDEDFNTE